MAKIVGIEGMNDAEIAQAMTEGGRFVVYQYVVSIIVLTFRRGSAIHFIPPGESAAKKGLPYTFLTLIAGWWGIPWGPIYTVGALGTNLGGGKDVTHHFELHHAEPQEPVMPARPVVGDVDPARA